MRRRLIPINEVFVDTAGWFCHVDAAQPEHAVASTLVAVCPAHGQTLVTSNYVLAEVVALLTSRRRVGRRQLISSIDTIKASPGVLVVHIDQTLDDAAWTLLKSRVDKEWSLVDCASFVVMQQRGIREALTTDHHFEQAGFAPLLRQ